MSSDKYPKLNRIYLAFVISVGIATAFMFVYFARLESAEEGARIFFAIFAVIVGLGPIYLTKKYSELKITDESVKSGGKEIKWRDVDGLMTVGYGIEIKSKGMTISVAPYAYTDPQKLIDKIAKYSSNGT